MGRALGLRLAVLGALVAALRAHGMLHLTEPRRVRAAAGLGQVSYALTIEGKPYTVHLKQQLFIPSEFRVYTYNVQGSLLSDFAAVRADCYYQGYIEGVPNSAVMLSTCSGLRGLLQFENVSYGIEPLDSSSGFEHLVYQIKNGSTERLLSENEYMFRDGEQVSGEVSHTLHIELAAAIKLARYLELAIVLDKGLYNYMGSDKYVVTRKIVQLIGFVNSMFSRLNVTIVLSSLEFWTDYNKIITTGEANELLHRFVKWKNSHLVLRPHDMAYLLVYRDHPRYAGTTFAGKMCVSNYSGAVALYQDVMTLESFSIVVAQLLGLSLGMTYDDSRTCQCSGPTCIMHRNAILFSGVKSFSSCSIEDFETFITHSRGHCLSNRPHLNLSYKRPSCGNGIIEDGEQCDCGSSQECTRNRCCTTECRLARGAGCAAGLCCSSCQIKARNRKCRERVDNQCDLPEFCNGTSAFCPEDVFVQNGYKCEHNTGYCYNGHCQAADLHCQRIYGRGSKNGPDACYEEVNSQTDRFGHCGNDPNMGYKSCSWTNLKCGKLICTYPIRVPFIQENTAVIYAQVREDLCVSLDYMQPATAKDPMMVKDGTMCANGKVCIAGKCQVEGVLGYDCNPETKCSGHGVCNSKKNCHCDIGWQPPNCQTRGSGLGGSIDSGLRFLGSDAALERAAQRTMKNWLLLGFCLFLPVLVGAALMVAKRKELSQLCAEEESQADEESPAPSLPEEPSA